MTVQELKQTGQWESRYISGKGLVPVLQKHGENLVGLEIGICTGENIYNTLENCPNISMLHAIDPYKAYQDWNHFISQEEMDAFQKEMLESLKDLSFRITFHFKSSVDALASFKDGEFNYIFVDGVHDYLGVYQDLKLYYPKLASGGIFAGHDYNSAVPDVIRAIDNFRFSRRIEAPFTVLENNAWYWIKP